MEEGTEPQEDVFEEAIEEASQEVEQSQDVEVREQQEEKRVPVSAVQKERRKRQEAEAESQRARIELQFYRDQMNKKTSEPEQEDETQYESATRADLKQSAAQIKEETLRDLEERMWIKANPEKAERVNEDLKEFLKQRPNLTGAISAASNRYEEAFILMEALTAREQAKLRPALVKRESPGSPTSVPKAAAINQVVDIMQMNDEEYRAWRQTKRQRR